MKNLQSSITYSDYNGIIRAKARVTGEEDVDKEIKPAC